MPYATNADLPEAIRHKYGKCASVFRGAFNSAFEAHGESRAFAIAHAAAQRCQRGKESSMTLDVAARAAKKAPPLAPGEFRFITKAIGIEPHEEGQPRRFKMIASSTIIDEGKDEIKMSALEDLRASYASGRNVFTDHEHKVDNVFGRTDFAAIKDSGERDPKTGAPIFDLHIGGIVNEPNPRMVQLADSIDGGYVNFGSSIGAKVKEAKRNKAGGMDIYHLDGKEVSLVGIPMNQRSWTYKSTLMGKAVKAAEALGEEFLDDDDDDEPETEHDHDETAKALDVDAGEALVRQDLEGPKEKADKCPDCGGDHAAEGCSNDYHTAKSDDLAGTPEAPDDAGAEPESNPIVASADGQESESESVSADAETPETPETASAVEDEDAAKAFTFETTDVITLARKARDLAELVSKRDEEIAALKAERDRLASENEEAKTVIEKVLALPLRRKAIAPVADLSQRLPEFLAPGVKEFLTKTATGEPR